MAKIKILVVDDSSTSNLLCKSLLEEQDYKVITAENGYEAIKMVYNHMPDAILLDIMMPDIDGYTVLARIKSEKETEHIPVIIISAKDDQKSIKMAFALGADDFVSKPLGKNKLVDSVKKLFVSKSMRATNNVSDVR
jgi:response regulator RpfG family c-di-GMP phosphodiesterase